MTSQTQQQILEQVEQIAVELVAKQEAITDKEAKFPTAAVAALGKAGVLGALSAKEVGGSGLGPRAAVLIVERLARECASTAMVVCMHFAAVAVLEKQGLTDVRKQAAAGALATLAFSEAGSRSQFWAPLSTATRAGDQVTLQAKKN